MPEGEGGRSIAAKQARIDPTPDPHAPAARVRSAYTSLMPTGLPAGHRRPTHAQARHKVQRQEARHILQGVLRREGEEQGADGIFSRVYVMGGGGGGATAYSPGCYAMGG